MNQRQIRAWLLQQPRPSVIRVTPGDGGAVEEIKTSARMSYMKLSETIEALGPDLLECLDKDGNMLRAKRAEQPEAVRSDAAAIPEGLAADPHALMLTHFANLLHRAYEHSTDIAFTKLVELVDKIDSRSDSIEQRLERAEAQHRRVVQQQVDTAFDRADELAAAALSGGEGDDASQQMLGAFLQGAMSKGGAPAKAGAPAAAPKPNGGK